MAFLRKKSDEISTKKPKKSMSFWKLLLAVIGLVFIFLITFSIFFWNAKPTIKINYVDVINKESRPADYDTNKNAATFYQKAVEQTQPMLEEIDLLKNEWPGDLNDMEVKSLEKWINSNNDALDLLKGGSSKSFCWIENNYPNNNLRFWEDFGIDLVEIRNLIYALVCRAKLSIMKNNFDAAVNDVEICFRVGEGFVNQGEEVYKLVGIYFKEIVVETSFQILDGIKLNSEKFKYLQERIQLLFNHASGKLDFSFGKFKCYDLIQRIFTDNGKGNGHLIPKAVVKERAIPDYHYIFGDFWKTKTKAEIKELKRQQPEFVKQISEMENRRFSEYMKLISIAITGPDRKQNTRIINKLFDYYDFIQTQKPWQLHERNIEPQKHIDSILKECYVFWGEGDVRLAIIKKSQRYDNKMLALINTIAILRYKADKDKLPENLNQLVVEGYIEELPIDLYSGKPFIYKKQKDDFILYSLGEDFDDDGGKGYRWGVGPEGGDQVFWPVEQY